MSPAPALLCLTSYDKGQDFLRSAGERGARVLLLTVESLKDVEWPRDALAAVHFMPSLTEPDHVIRAVSWLARTERIDRVVALDEFDLEVAAALREHLRIPGMGESATRFFRDKLAMRMKAAEAGIAVPDFTAVFNDEAVRDFASRAPPPWVLKPRLAASTTGIERIGSVEELWRALERAGDERSFRLLERFVPGAVYHVDGLVQDGELRFAEAHRYARPPLDVYHGGGLFCSRTVERGSEEEAALVAMTVDLVATLGLHLGALHAEFIRGEDGRLWFLEIGARVGGAHIADMIEAATGVNPWREWAGLEFAAATGGDWRPPTARREYGGVLITLARQEWPDTSGYDAPEIVLRPARRHHAGLVLRSPDSARLDALLSEYMARFLPDFHASMPAADRPTA